MPVFHVPNDNKISKKKYNIFLPEIKSNYWKLSKLKNN